MRVGVWRSITISEVNLPVATHRHLGVIAATRLIAWVHLRQIWRRIVELCRISPAVLILVGLFLAGYVALGLWISLRAFRFLASFPGLGSLLVERMMYLLFAFLFGLLLLSNLILAYGSLFRNEETLFLSTMPIEPSAIVTWRLIESTILASWAFLFLASPILIAFGVHAGVGWHYYIVAVVYLALFILLPGCIGCWLAIALARYLDRRSFQLTLLLMLILVVIFAAKSWKPLAVQDTQLETRVLVVLDRLLARTRFALFPFLPSYWLASGLIRWTEGALQSALFFAALSASYALMFGYITTTGLGRAFLTALNTVQSRSSLLAGWRWWQWWRDARRLSRSGTAGTTRLVRCLQIFKFLPSDVRAFVAKDLRLFWRDTTQWAQTVVLFGLLGVYFLNLGHFSQQLTSPFWITIISFLNLGACSLNLATLTTRFVYPHFSLEGKRVWIIGLAPMGLKRVLWTKFLTMSLLCWIISAGLILLSCRMLQLPREQWWYHLIAVSIMTLTLNGLAIGLSVLYPNFREDNPSRVVSGFGGTFCLVLSFLYIVGSVLILASAAPWSFRRLPQPEALLIGWGVFVAVSFALGFLPFRAGLRRIDAFEWSTVANG